LSFKNYNRNDTNHALKRARSGGCVAPPKCGSIFNKSCTKSTCNNSVQTTSPIPDCGTIIDISTICHYVPPEDGDFPNSYRLKEDTTISECQILLLSDDVKLVKPDLTFPVLFIIPPNITLTNNGKIILNTFNFPLGVGGSLNNETNGEIYNNGSGLFNANFGGVLGTITNNGKIYNYNGGIFSDYGTYIGSASNFVNADGTGSCGTGLIFSPPPTTFTNYIPGCPPPLNI